MKILLTESIDQKGIDLLKEHHEVIISETAETNNLLKHTGDIDAIIVRSTKLENCVVDSAKNLKVIGRHGIGLDNIDVEYATSKGIKVVNTPTANSNSVAEHTLAMMMALSKNLLPSTSIMKSGELSRKNRSLTGLGIEHNLGGYDLKGKTLGIAGFGRIGKLIAKKCIAAFEMKILVYDPPIYQKVELPEGVEWAETINDLAKDSDYISLNLPLTKETENLISKEQFNQMKESAILINCSRGGIVNENDAYEALKSKKIYGAGFDVFSSEPPLKENPLFSLNNVILTPHIAASSKECREAMAIEISQGVIDVLSGEKPYNLVN